MRALKSPLFMNPAAVTPMDHPCVASRSRRDQQQEYDQTIINPKRYNPILTLALIILLASCHSKHKYTAAIRDFRKSIQPLLIKMATTGYVTYHDRTLVNDVTDDEWRRLSRSENPILRAIAYREMFIRDTAHHFDLLMNHLDDTAIVAVDAGEFGIVFQTVSDDILQKARWPTYEAREKTIAAVLVKHNYLRSAYIILDRLKPQEEYYPYIKDMATRPRRLSDEGFELDFDDIEYALYGLAKFNKQEDVQLIKKQLLKNVRKLSYVSFNMLKAFPDTAYFEVLQVYHRRQFYKFSGTRPGGFSGYYADRAAPEDFISALAAQQSTSSAQLLDSMLTYMHKYPALPDKEHIRRELIAKIWEHPCAAYASLREKIKVEAEAIIKGRYVDIKEIGTVPLSTEKIIRWLN